MTSHGHSAPDLNTVYGYWCVTCGAMPREKCRAVIRRDVANGQEVDDPHQRRRDAARRGESDWVTIDCAKRTRSRLAVVWA